MFAQDEEGALVSSYLAAQCYRPALAQRCAQQRQRRRPAPPPRAPAEGEPSALTGSPDQAHRPFNPASQSEKCVYAIRHFRCLLGPRHHIPRYELHLLLLEHLESYMAGAHPRGPSCAAKRCCSAPRASPSAAAAATAAAGPPAVAVGCQLLIVSHADGGTRMLDPTAKMVIRDGGGKRVGLTVPASYAT